MQMKMMMFFAVLGSSIVLAAAPGSILREKIQNGKTYSLFRVAKLPADLHVLDQEEGKVTFYYDKKNLRVSIVLMDADIVSESPGDQEQQSKFGDTVRIFVKPAAGTEFWEIYVDSKGHKSCFFHWGPGRMFYPPATEAAPLKIQAKTGRIAGGWKCEVVFPLSQAAKSRNLPANTIWHVMAGRHNYGANLDFRYSSSYPQAVNTAVDIARFGELN